MIIAEYTLVGAGRGEKGNVDYQFCWRIHWRRNIRKSKSTRGGVN